MRARLYTLSAMVTSPPPFSLIDANWLAHRHIEQQDRFRLIYLPRGAHASAPFLTDAALGERPMHDIPVDAALALPDGRQSAGPDLHFLFHSAFCASTLLTRSLSVPGISMGLSEPVLLNDIVGFRQRGAAAAAVARLADLSLRMLARPFGAGEAVIVKPSNLLNPLAHLLLALRPNARALWLYAPLETFLVSVAHKGLECRLWVRELLRNYLRDGAITLGFTPDDYLGQSDLQIAAIGWLAQHQIMTALARGPAKGRIACLDSESLLGHPDVVLGRVAGHFKLALDEPAIAAITSGPAFATHSKSGASYDVAQRRADYAAVRAAHGDEIGKVVIWAHRVAEHADIDMGPAAPFLGL